MKKLQLLFLCVCVSTLNIFAQSVVPDDFYDMDNPYDYEDLEGQPALDPFLNTNSFDGEFQFFDNKYHFIGPPLGSSIGISGDSMLELVSFPFAPDFDASGNTQRIFKVMSDETYVEPLDKMYSYWDIPNEGSLKQVSTHFQRTLASYFFQEGSIPENTGDKDIAFHSILKATEHFYCGPPLDFSIPREYIDSMSFVMDLTRGKIREYPFRADNGPTFNADVHDVTIFPFVHLSPSFTETNNAYNTLDYYPASEAAFGGCNGIGMPDNKYYPGLGTSTDDPATADPSLFVHPAPYSLPSFYLMTGNGATPVGFQKQGAFPQTLTERPGIPHQYFIDKNIDLTIINPSERIIYNPTQVFITADDLVFPSGYTFQTVTGRYPTVAELDASDCPARNLLDPREIPVSHLLAPDLDNQTYEYQNAAGQTINVPIQHPSVYILEPGSKLTIEPCVFLNRVAFVVKDGASLTYYPPQTNGNYQIWAEDNNDVNAVSSLNDKCNDCRCRQEYDYESGLTISAGQTVTWNENKIVKGKVIIEQGGRLNIQNAVVQFIDSEMSDETFVLVERGGQLHIDDSKLTVLGCHKMWDGIRVLGNGGSPQLLASQYGLVSVENSTIEKARIGIKVGHTFIQTNNGGKVRAWNAKFLNNHTAVIFGMYNHVNNSYFYSCTFDQTERIEHQFSEYGEIARHILLVGTKGIHFKNCIFDNSLHRFWTDHYLDDKRGTGILSFFSSANIDELPASYPFYPDNSNSRFRNLYKGIDHYALGSFETRISAKEAIFENVMKNISSQGSVFDEMIGNTFDFPDEIENVVCYGIYELNSSGFVIADNRFASSCEQTTLPDGLFFYNDCTYSHALIVNNSGEGGGIAHTNYFRGTGVGTQTEEDNRSLQIKCNEYIDYTCPRYAWFINPDDQNPNLEDRLGDQGSGCSFGQTAGNLFFDECAQCPCQVCSLCSCPGSGPPLMNKIRVIHWETGVPPFSYFGNGTPYQTVPENLCVTGFVSVTDCENLIEDINACPEIPADETGYGGKIHTETPEDLGAMVAALSNDPKNPEQLYATNEVMQAYSATERLEDARLFLEALKNDHAHKLLTVYYYSKGQNTAAAQHLAQLNTGSYENQSFYNLMDILVDAQFYGRDLNNLKPEEQSEIENIAASNSALAIQAQSILAYQQLSDYQREPYQASEPAFKKESITINEETDIIIYPNPTTAALHVENIPTNSLVRLLDVNGRVLKQENATSNLLWGTKGFPSGVYLLHLATPAGRGIVRKVIITK